MKISQSNITSCIILCLYTVISGCSGQNNDPVALQDSTNIGAAQAPIVNDAQNDLGGLLTTGSDKSNTKVYWNCETIRVDGTFAENIHVRFWANGEGFSGTSPTTWAQTATDEISISYDGGTVSLIDINMFSLENEFDYFTATEEPDATVRCTRKGPLRNSAGSQVFDDFSPRDSLVADLTTKDNQKWQCIKSTNSEAISTVDIQLLSDKSAYLDQSAGTWFVDDRYKAIIAINGNVDALSKIVLDPAKSNFTAQWFDSNLSCAKTQL